MAPRADDSVRLPRWVPAMLLSLVLSLLGLAYTTGSAAHELHMLAETMTQQRAVNERVAAQLGDHGERIRAVEVRCGIDHTPLHPAP